MRVPLAWRNLAHQPARTLVAVVGVAFALILIFMQLGFYGAVKLTATQLYDVLDFDLMLLSSQYVDLNQPQSFPEDRLYQARTQPGVASATPVSAGLIAWQRTDVPPSDEGGAAGSRRRSIMVLGFDPDAPVFRAANFTDPAPIVEGVPRLRAPDTVLIDTYTRKEFGPQDPGTVAKLGNLRVEIAGRFTLGTGFSADGLVFAGAETFRRAFGFDPRRSPNFGLLKLEPGADPRAVAAALGERLPPDVQVLTRDELLEREQDHWVTQTAVGVIFFIGVVVALVVGVVFVYQVMASDITNHLPEYATLKAIGYTDRYLTGVVLRQALILALLGYAPGFAAALGLYAVARPAGIPAYMTADVALGVLLLGLLMCGASALLAVRKAKGADPADLF